MHQEFRKKANPSRATAVVLVTMLLALCGDAQAKKIYKWVDKNGKTHYGDSAPTDAGTAQEIRVPKTRR